MAECIVDTFGIVQDFADLHGDMSTPLYQAIMDMMVSRQREEIVRCRDCRHGNEVTWPTGSGIPQDYLDCTGELVETWDYYNDQPSMNPVKPDGYCAWACRKEGE